MANLSAMTERHLDGGSIRRNFSGHAAEYDRYAVVQKRVVERLLGSLDPHRLRGRCLDVGTGTGLLALGAMESSPQLRPILSDLAHGMTRQARSRLGDAPAVDADACALPLRDASVELVLSSSVYQWVEDLSAAFAESARVLVPGGTFAFALFGGRTLHELREAHRQAVAEAGGQVSHVQEFPGEGQVRGALEGAGFSEMQLWSEEECELHPDVPALLRGLKHIGASNAAKDRPAGLASRRVMERMIELYESRHRRDGAIPATYQVVYGFGVKPQGGIRNQGSGQMKGGRIF